MSPKVIEKRIDEERSAKVEHDEYGAHIFTMNNGNQWSGAAIYSVDVAEAAIEVLQDYVSEMRGREK